MVGTAGHIDHGKTSLVRALTGVDLDRHPEEKARGITISLGFTRLGLPSGAELSFVDVPGHERLVRTMIAGASGLHAVLFCVSAVEGVMPQTREHLAILEILGVSQGVVALTMCDLVDEEMLELATLDVEETIEGTFLEGAPILATSAGPQPSGLDELIAALDALQPQTTVRPGPFRLPVDRAFVQRGFGTVVTGTARAGTLSDGDEVEILPLGLRARVRGIQVHGEESGQAAPGRRTALNLAGVERDDLARGMVVVARASVAPASILDVRLDTLPSAPPLPQDSRVRLLLDTAEVMAVITVLDRPTLEPGASQLVQLRTESPIVALEGDRIVVRRQSPVETLGGGVVLDPQAPRVRQRHAARAAEELTALEGGERAVLLRRAGEGGLSDKDAERRGVLGVGRRLGDRWLDPARVAKWEDLLIARLGDWHAAHNLAPGAPKRELHRAELPRMAERAFDQLLGELAAAGRIVLEGPRMRLPDFTVQPTPEQTRTLAQISGRVRSLGFEGPRTAELLRAHAPEVTHLVDAGVLVRVADKLLHRDRLDEVAAKVQGWLSRHPSMSAPEFKELCGLSRKHAIPLLEWLDASEITRREGDLRVAR